MSNVKISADMHTREKLGINHKDSVSEEEAQRLHRGLEGSKEFRSVLQKEGLVIKRVIRD